MAEIAKIKGYDIRDKKLADATSQSTVAATDAIEMKTTSGDQVYITRDSFVQAMASVLNSNSQSTISQLFGADANGNHAAINMSNLATILAPNLNFVFIGDYNYASTTVGGYPLPDWIIGSGSSGIVIKIQYGSNNVYGMLLLISYSWDINKFAAATILYGNIQGSWSHLTFT